MEFKSVLHLCGRATAETAARGCNCLAFAIHGELRRITEYHGVTWPADFPQNVTELAEVFAQLRALGFEGGLWSSTGVPNIADEVAVAGSRVCKTDVGWIGDG